MLFGTLGFLLSDSPSFLLRGVGYLLLTDSLFLSQSVLLLLVGYTALFGLDPLLLFFNGLLSSFFLLALLLSYLFCFVPIAARAGATRTRPIFLLCLFLLLGFLLVFDCGSDYLDRSNHKDLFVCCNNSMIRVFCDNFQLGSILCWRQIHSVGVMIHVAFERLKGYHGKWCRLQLDGPCWLLVENRGMRCC